MEINGLNLFDHDKTGYIGVVRYCYMKGISLPNLPLKGGGILKQNFQMEFYTSNQFSDNRMKNDSWSFLLVVRKR